MHHEATREVNVSIEKFKTEAPLRRVFIKSAISAIPCREAEVHESIESGCARRAREEGCRDHSGGRR